jgi:preprotein translocase subunit SecD
VILPADPKAYPGSSGIRYVLGPADLTGSAVSGATETMNTTTGQYSVQLTLTSAGAAEFDTLAATRFACYTQDPSSPSPCSEEAFELQGVVESAPTFQAARFNGHVEITGNFSRAQAQALANELKPGSADEHYVPLPTG